MKIVLVYPNQSDLTRKYRISTLAKYPSRPPLGLLYLAAILEKAGHEVKIYDNVLRELPSAELAGLILAERPDLVGFSTTFKNMPDAKKTAGLIKKKERRIKSAAIEEEVAI